MWNLIRQNRLVDDREKVKVSCGRLTLTRKQISYATELGPYHYPPTVGSRDAHRKAAHGEGIPRPEEERALKAHTPQN